VEEKEYTYHSQTRRIIDAALKANATLGNVFRKSFIKEH